MAPATTKQRRFVEQLGHKLWGTVEMKFFVLTYTKSPIGESGESCKSVYTFEDACEKCGTGAKLDSALKTKAINKVNKDLFETLDGDYIISERLYKILLQRNVQFDPLYKILNTKGAELPYYHLYTKRVLPPTYQINGIKIDRQCPVCKRNGFFCQATIGDSRLPASTAIAKTELIYNRIEPSFLNSSDLFFSWEGLGLSNKIAYDKYVIRFARPYVIISEKLKDILIEFSIKGLMFEEVVFL